MLTKLLNCITIYLAPEDLFTHYIILSSEFQINEFYQSASRECSQYIEPVTKFTELGYGLGGLRSIPARVRYFSLLHNVQTESGAHPASYPVSSLGKTAGDEADYSPPSSSEDKNGGALPPLPTTSSWSGA
jgi:hypothetical protein